jgi:hypothetical protein
LIEFFCTTEFEERFPLAHARALPRVGSDHTPIVWDSGCDQIPKKSGFKFEKWWISRPNFKDLVIKAWSLARGNKSAIDNWHDKCKYFRRLARGWSANLEADIRKHKKDLMEEYDSLDILAETQPLDELNRKRLDDILIELNTYWVIE